MSLLLDLWIEIEERIQAGLELFLDILFAAFKHVHSHVSFAAVFQLYGCVAHFRHIVGGQQAHSIHQR